MARRMVARRPVVFLDQFLRVIGRAELCSRSDRPKVRCHTPASCVPEGGLIDITIEWPDFCIGVENTSSAAEQEGQLWRYWQHLDIRYGGHFCLVFLDGRGKPPETISEKDRRALELEGKLKMLSHVPHLRDWLDVCGKESKADKLRWFLRGLAGDVGRYQMPIGGELQWETKREI